MRNSNEILYQLTEISTKKPNYVYERLYRHFYNPDMYLKAYENLSKNQGSGTPGIDGETADGFSMQKIEGIIKKMKDESYQPKPVKRIYIPKKNGNKRPLGIPTFTDRLVQEVARMLLNAIYDPTFENFNHGFRPNHSCHTALSQTKIDFRGSNWFVEGDIKGFFDNISHQKLIQLLKIRIDDEKFIRLIWKFLRAGFLENWQFFGTYSGTPQGGIVSPILANIYLDAFDKWFLDYKKTYDRGDPKDKKVSNEYKKYDARIVRAKRKLKSETDLVKTKEIEAFIAEQMKIREKLPYYTYEKSGYRRAKCIRYADDFVIAVWGSKNDAEEVKSAIKTFMDKELAIELSEEKTFITHTNDGAKFLGYEIKVLDDWSFKKDKNGNRKRMWNGSVEFYMPKNVIKNYIVQNNWVKDIDAKSWRMLHEPSLINHPEIEIVMYYNARLRGLYNYYKLAINVSHYMWQLHHVAQYSCLATLANKHKSSIAKMKTKYKSGEHWGVPYENKKGEKKTRYFHKEGFPRVKQFDAENNPDLYPNLKPYFYGTVSFADRLKASRCEKCGTDDPTKDYDVHHVNKMKNLKGKSKWERTMIGKNRKTLIVCEDCHYEIHNG